MFFGEQFPELIKYLVDKQDAFKYSHGSHVKINIHCPDCGYEKEIAVQKLCLRGFNCPICKDGFSFAAKILRQLLIYNNCQFEMEYSPHWAKGKRYDFFIQDSNTIIEVHGAQHYGLRNEWGYTKNQSLKNDLLKKELAFVNEVINYIEINASNTDFASLSTEINQQLSGTIIIPKTEELKQLFLNSTSSLKKEAFLLYQQGFSQIEISKKLNISRKAVERYLPEYAALIGEPFVNRAEQKEINLHKTYNLIQENYSQKQIAEILQVSTATVRNYLKELDKRPEFCYTYITEQEKSKKRKQQAIELHKQGLTIKEISDNLKINRNQIAKYLKEVK